MEDAGDVAILAVLDNPARLLQVLIGIFLAVVLGVREDRNGKGILRRLCWFAVDENSVGIRIGLFTGTNPWQQRRERGG
jgi:hypothetical protein